MQNIETTYLKPTNSHRLTLIAAGLPDPDVIEKQVAIPPQQIQHRINCKLCMDSPLMLMENSRPETRFLLGNYIIWNMETNMVEGVHVDLAELADQLNVLGPNEYIARLQ